MLPENYPYIPDYNLIRNWGLDPKVRESNLRRQRRYQLKHRFDKKPVPAFDAVPQGHAPTWAIHALINANNVICFIAACRADGTIQGIVSGWEGCREIDLFHHLCKQREARDIVKGLVRTCRPAGNAAPSKSGRGHWIGGQNSGSLAFWSTF